MQISDRLIRMINAPSPAQRSPEWFQARNDKITGSIIDAIIYGRTAYTTRDRLLLEKAGMPVAFKGNVATRHGTLHEPVAIREYEKQTGHVVLEMGLVMHPECDLLAHSPDGIVFRSNERPILLEVKTPFRRVFEHDSEIPSCYYHQVQLGMDTFDLEACDFVQFRPETPVCKQLLTILRVPREEGWRARIWPVISAFWNEVMLYRRIGWEQHPLAHKLRPKAEPECMVCDDSDEEDNRAA